MKAKKFLAICLALVMVLSLSVTAFADNSDGESYIRGSITINNPQENESYNAYKIFDVTYDLTDSTNEKYAYTINPEWVTDVIAYTGATADADGVYTGKGLTLTPVKDTEGTIKVYNVTYDKATFSAPDFGEKMAANTSGKTAIPLTTPDGGSKPVATGLDLGYYMVQPTTANSLVSLTTTDADVTVSDKNEKPVVDKSILGKELNCSTEHEHTAACYKDVKEDHTTASVGDKVEFQLDTKIPDMTGYETYFFVANDTMSKGLSFNDDVVVTVNGDTLTKNTDYSVKAVPHETDGTTVIRIVFNDMVAKFKAGTYETGDAVVITYSATVNQDAVMGTVGNTNTAKIEYSNNPNVKPEPDPDTPPEDPNDPKDPGYKHNDPQSGVKDPTGESNPDKVTVYSSELELAKVDANGGAALTGAKFKIEGEKLNVSIVNKTIFEESTDGTWYRLKDGTYTQESPAGKDEPLDPTYEAMPSTFEPVTKDESGTITFYNTPGLYYLDGETYVLVTEGNAATVYVSNPDGDDYYKQINWKQSDKYEDTSVKYKKVEVVDKTTNPENYTAEGWVDENGKLTFGGLAEGTYYVTELVAPDGYNLLKDPIKVEVTLVESGSTDNPYKFLATINGGSPISEGATGAIPFNVENNQGVELPETGGIGTTLFYVIGGLMVVAAGVLLITKKRMGAEG